MASKIYDIPVIDISSFLNETDKISVAQQVSKACENNGFLIISGHGIPKNIINNAFTQSRAFFQFKPNSQKFIPPGNSLSATRVSCFCDKGTSVYLGK